MADEKPAQAPEVAQPPEAEAAATESSAAPADAKSPQSETAPAAEPAKKEEEVKNAEDDKPTEESSTAVPSTTAPADKEKHTDADAEMKDKPAEGAAEAATETKAASEKPAEESAGAAAESAAASADADNAGDKSKARRKSSALPEHLKGGKKLNKKASKAKILHLDAKPGEHFFAKLKGFPLWPVIICEEDMLPQNMLSSRPVTAARPDGTYREDFADGGKRAADRTYPVMYLHTNEFGWTVNTDLSELDPSTVADLITPKMRKDLQAAHLLAAEHNDLDYYKNVLREFEEQRLANLEAKAAKRTPKKKAVEPAADEDGDVEMAEAGEEANVESSEKKKKTKKRKAEDGNNTPQRSESVKKPKIKLTSNSTPKTANGTQSPNPGKESTSKPSKSKGKQNKATKETDANKAEADAAAAFKEPELTAEEKQMRKEKEILFLRHRLQKGLLIRDQEPKEEEMKPMSDFLAKLETFPDLEVGIIRATKINKVLKAILKLETIPKEDELKFKPRSQSLLDKWNKILATDGGASAPTAATTNGVNGTSGEAAKKDKEATNGIKETVAEKKPESPKDAEKVTASEQVTKEETAKAASGDSETESKPTADDAKPATLDAPTKIGSAA